MAAIKMASIAMPEHYVRGKLSSANIKDLMDVVFKTHAHLAKDKEKGVQDYKELIGKKLKWPFDTPIIVVRNPEPEKGEPLKGKGVTVQVKGKGKKKTKVATFKPHELVDGGHRFTIWRRLKQKEIEATVKNIPNLGERFMEQYRTNVAHGMRLDKDARDNAIRTAHEVYRISLSILADKTGLDRSSIVRIISNKQRTGKPKAKGKGTLVAPAGVADEMSVQGFIDRVQTLHANYERLQKSLEDYLAANITNSGRTKLGSIVATLKRIASSFAKPLENKDGKGEVKKNDEKPIIGNLPPGTQI